MMESGRQDYLLSMGCAGKVAITIGKTTERRAGLFPS